MAQSSHGPGFQWIAVKPGFTVKSGFFLMQGSLSADIPWILHLRVWGSNSRPGLDNSFSLGLPQIFEEQVSGSTSYPCFLLIPGDGEWFRGTMLSIHCIVVKKASYRLNQRAQKKFVLLSVQDSIGRGAAHCGLNRLWQQHKSWPRG